MPENRKQSSGTIRWQGKEAPVDYAELADLLERSFTVKEPINMPGYQKDGGNAGRSGKAADKNGGGRHFTEERVRITFGNSYAAAFAYDGDRLVACGRALSDGLEQGAIYNIAVDPDYQGRGLGRQVIAHLLDELKGCTVILYTHPQTVRFYEAIGWHRMKTAFMISPGHESEEGLERSVKSGFLLPKGYRYSVDESEYYPGP